MAASVPRKEATSDSNFMWTSNCQRALASKPDRAEKDAR